MNLLEVIVAISTVIIALSALVVSIWQGKIARKHAKLSVKPRLQFMTEYDISLIVKNTGLGPAFLESFEIIYQGKDFNFFKRNEVEQLMTLAGLDNYSEWGDAWGGPTLGVGDKFVLWRLKGNQPQKYRRLMHLLNKSVDFKGTYKSLYDEIYSF